MRTYYQDLMIVSSLFGLVVWRRVDIEIIMLPIMLNVSKIHCTKNSREKLIVNSLIVSPLLRLHERFFCRKF